MTEYSTMQQSKLKMQLKNLSSAMHLFEVIDLARKGNKYLQEKEPWKKVTWQRSNRKLETNKLN